MRWPPRRFFVGFAFAYFLLLAAIARADEPLHVCGQGSHTITVREPGACPDSCTTSLPELMPDGSYLGGSMTCTLAICYNDHEQTWTDWPECVGAEMVRPKPEDASYLFVTPTEVD